MCIVSADFLMYVDVVADGLWAGWGMSIQKNCGSYFFYFTVLQGEVPIRRSAYPVVAHVVKLHDM